MAIECQSCPLAHLSPGPCPFITRGVGKGSTLFEEGEPAHTLLFVKHGSVILERGIADPIAWKLQLPGSLVGIEALTMPRYACSARTATASQVCTVARAHAQSYLSNSATVLLTRLAEQWLEMPPSVRKPAVVRVAEWLLDTPADVPSSIQRNVIAELLAMTPETLSRALNDLAERGAIRVTRRTIEIADEKTLREHCVHENRRAS